MPRRLPLPRRQNDADVGASRQEEEAEEYDDDAEAATAAAQGPAPRGRRWNDVDVYEERAKMTRAQRRSEWKNLKDKDREKLMHQIDEAIHDGAEQGRVPHGDYRSIARSAVPTPVDGSEFAIGTMSLPNIEWERKMAKEDHPGRVQGPAFHAPIPNELPEEALSFLTPDQRTVLAEHKEWGLFKTLGARLVSEGLDDTEATRQLQWFEEVMAEHHVDAYRSLGLFRKVYDQHAVVLSYSLDKALRFYFCFYVFIEASPSAQIEETTDAFQYGDSGIWVGKPQRILPFFMTCRCHRHVPQSRDEARRKSIRKGAPMRY